MSDIHHIYLNLGSNLQPEVHLPEAIRQLRKHGGIKSISNAWESHALGSKGPDFINISLEFLTSLKPGQLKHEVIRPIEQSLGRVRGKDKNAPRPVDIDVIMADGRPLNRQHWAYPFVIVPTAELTPDLIHPLTHENLAEVAKRTLSQIWIVKRPEFLEELVKAVEQPTKFEAGRHHG